MAGSFQAPRGTRDLLPGETERWRWVEEQALRVLDHYDYREIRTPIFEEYELFARTSGETSDVVQKEMYRFRDLKGRDLALRPEGTAPVARAYLEHGLAGQGRIHRLWYQGPMFRYSRPQKGRLRQFFQIGAEIIGTSAAGADVEVIALFVDLFEAWGLRELTVKLNSLGTPETRRQYAAELRRWLDPIRTQLSPDSQARFEVNPLRVLDSKDPRDLELLEASSGMGEMPKLLDLLPQEDRTRFFGIRADLEAMGIACETDHGLVRGLDYYTHTAFEVHDRSLGAQSALGGGGRYDGLIEALGGPPTPGVGFSIGLDRVLLACAPGAVPAGPQVFVASMEATRAAAAPLVRKLRHDFVVDWDLEGRGMGAQMKAAGRSGARFLVLLGEEEWRRGEVALKDLKSGDQQTVKREDLDARLRERLAATREGHAS